MARHGWLVTLGVAAILSFPAAAQQGVQQQAEKLFQRTDYMGTLELLKSAPDSSAKNLLAGQCWYVLGDFKKATDYFEKAVKQDPKNSVAQHWLGRGWGRRAETSNPLQAPIFASRARQAFEESVRLDSKNEEAINDLFQYYLEAPGFLGGGLDKAAALTEKIKANDPVEYHYALAQLAMRQKQFDVAESQLRSAAELAPRQIGRVVDLARFLARQGKIDESDKTFQQAAKIDPHSKKLLYARAETYIESKRNLDEAKRLLQQYLQASLTPEDPSREDAKKLLKRAGGAE